VQRGDRAEGAGVGSVQGRDQPDTERPGDPLPRIEQRAGVAELVRPQRLHQRLQQRGDDQADGDGSAGQDRRDQPQRVAVTTSCSPRVATASTAKPASTVTRTVSPASQRGRQRSRRGISRH
jgi:hypothetical protein